MPAKDFYSERFLWSDRPALEYTYKEFSTPFTDRKILNMIPQKLLKRKTEVGFALDTPYTRLTYVATEYVFLNHFPFLTRIYGGRDNAAKEIAKKFHIG